MGLELEKKINYFFKKIEANYQSSSSYVFWVAPLFLTIKEHL